jgi:aldose 1-epimerase
MPGIGNENSLAAELGKRPTMAAIEREQIGETSAGRRVELFSLTNDNGLKAKITTFGATLVSLLIPDRRNLTADVVLGFDDPMQYLGDHPYFGSVIGRYANRIAGASFGIAGKNYRLRANDRRNHLHGGTTGLDKRLWNARPAITAEGAQLALEYFSHDGEEGYPGNLLVQVIYTLNARNELRLDYYASTDRETVVNLTNHSYFNLAGDGTVDNHFLRLAARRYLPVDDELVPTGEQRSVVGSAFDFTRARSLATGMAADEPQLRVAGGYDHCWVLAADESGTAVLAAELYEPISGRLLKVFTTQPGIQVYSANLLDGGISGKGGCFYQKHAGLCLETQHFPDSPHQPAFPTTVLKPGDSYKQCTVYRFSVKD